MKKIILILITLHLSFFTPQYCGAQGAWTARDTLPDSAMFQGIPGFSIGNYGYAGLGQYSYKYFDELWQFDPSINSWTKKAPFPGKARVAPACFVIGNDAYLVCGSINNGGICVNECWQYDAINDKWAQKANFPGPARTYAVGFAIDSLGYVGTGANELSDFRKDFYAYHPSTNTWTKIADFPGMARDGDCGFAVNGNGYVCFGQDSTINQVYNDMWEYDPVANKWTQKANKPGAKVDGANGFTICNNIYVGDGDSSNNEFLSVFWKYNTTTDTWSQVASTPLPPRIQGIAFAIGDTGYLGFGCDYKFNTHNIFDEFYGGDSCNISDGLTEVWKDEGIEIYPNPFKDECFVQLPNVPNNIPIISLYDINGREARAEIERIDATKYLIKSTGLPQGVYILNVQFKNQIIHKKLILIN